MFLPIVLISGICLYLSFWWKRRRMVELSKDVPSWSTCLPLLGHAHRFIGDNANPHDQRTFQDSSNKPKHGWHTLPLRSFSVNSSASSSHLESRSRPECD
ncbi:hypothetical protein EVAR_23908_1 [Eumeta japonica]|uniref:Uncharacterized protein n=1 Tax=Eumeta variegata TaxID=151549 RepID=A0A4C1V1V3_EUMVA|nr:hypothetical protein EVAR_23908_1 [Eumeta japonica]